jgi:hypothetical protein
MNRADGSVSVFACGIKGACPGMTVAAGVNQTVCTTGYGGVLCGLCADGYVMAGDGTCGKCSEVTVLGVIVVILVIIVFIVLLTQVKKWCAEHPPTLSWALSRSHNQPRALRAGTTRWISSDKSSTCSHR